MHLPSDVHICDTDHQNSMTEINSFDIYSRHKQSVYDTLWCMSRKTSPSGWITPEIILLNDLKMPQKWDVASPMPLTTLTNIASYDAHTQVITILHYIWERLMHVPK